MKRDENMYHGMAIYDADDFGDAIKDKRQVLYKSREELSKETGVSLGTIESLERGKLKSIENLLKVLNGIGVSLIWRNH